MKRFTITFTSTNSSISSTDLRGEIDQVLLRLHPRITYKMGQVFRGLDGNFLAQVSVDGKRQLLHDAFSRHKWALPVNFRRLSWGWLQENEDASLIFSVNRSIEVDPFKEVSPLGGEGEYLLIKHLLRGKYLALLISTVALLVIFIANTAYPKTAWLMFLFAVAFAIFMFALSDTPLDLRTYCQKISIRSDGLELRYWLKPNPALIAWDSIWGMDYSSPTCELLAAQRKMRFLLSEQYGCKEQLPLLKTIVTRAGLLYVEGNFRKLSYRKPDAS